MMTMQVLHRNSDYTKQEISGKPGRGIFPGCCLLLDYRDKGLQGLAGGKWAVLIAGKLDHVLINTP